VGDVKYLQHLWKQTKLLASCTWYEEELQLIKLIPIKSIISLDVIIGTKYDSFPDNNYLREVGMKKREGVLSKQQFTIKQYLAGNTYERWHYQIQEKLKQYQQSDKWINSTIYKISIQVEFLAKTIVSYLTHKCKLYQAFFLKHPLQTTKMSIGHSQKLNERRRKPNLKRHRQSKQEKLIKKIKWKLRD